MKALLVLQLQHCDEASLKSCLSRLDLRVDVWAVNQINGGEKDSPESGHHRDLVFSQVISRTEDPTVLFTQNDDGSELQKFITLVWEVDVVLNRPRVWLSEPLIVIIPVVTLSESNFAKTSQAEYLTPFEPLEANVLEPIRNMPGLRENPPYLAASRLERFVLKPKLTESKVRIEGLLQKTYKILPVATTRIRYSRTSGGTSTLDMMASLDIELNTYVGAEASIEKAEMSLTHGIVDDFMSESLPIQCRPHDLLTLLYKLSPGKSQSGIIRDDSNIVSSMPTSTLDVLSTSVVIKMRLSDSCQPLIKMDWVTNVDFFQALNPSFVGPNQAIQQMSRPSNLPSAYIDNHHLNTKDLMTGAASSMGTAVTISFTAPKEPVNVGQKFSWQVLIANRSNRTIKLAVVPLPRVYRSTSQAQNFARRHAPKSSTASFHPTERRHTRSGEEFDIAQAIVDENVVYAMQHSHHLPSETDLISLTPEIIVGPLSPGQFHESTIELVAFVAGALRADVIRVIDLIREAEEGPGATGVIMDIRDLPDIIVNDSS